MRRLLIAVAVLAATLTPATFVGAAPREKCHFPAQHTARSGESLWTIADDFLDRVHQECDTRSEPTDRAVDNEVSQIRKLNRDELAGQHGQIYAGQRLLLANSIWEVPDGKPGWGTGYTACRI